MQIGVVRKFFLYSVGFGIVLGVLFPVFASIFVTFKSRSMMLLFSASCVLAGIMVGFVSYSIGKSTILKVVRKVSREIRIVCEKEGDLTKRIDFHSNDVLGSLVQNFNLLLEKFSLIVDGIRGISARTVKIKDELTTGTNETVESLVGVTTTTENIGSKVAILDSHISKSFSSVEEIAKTIIGLKNQIENQTSAVTQSTASVEQMIASLKSVSDTIQSKTQSTQRLNLAAKTGGEKIDATNRNIQLVLDDADSITNMVSIINSISSETNILAINAAIEGAHAGINGKGFSVIAEEIKKLAESANNNAKSISTVLEGTIQKMREASDAGLEMKDAFQNIKDDVVEVAGAFDEIMQSTAELSSGGTEILTATSELAEVQDRIREGATEMTSGAEEISESILEVKSISSDVTTSMSQIESTVAEITQVIVNVADASDQLRYSVEALNAEIGRYKTDES